MKLGIGSYTYPWAVGVPGYPCPQPMGALDLLEKARELGVRIVQICDNLPLHALSSAELAALAARAGACGLELEVGTRGCLPAHLRRYLDIARQVRSRLLRVVLDSAVDRPSLDAAVGRLSAVMPECKKSGIVLAVENHDRFSAHEFAKMVADVRSPSIGICLDTANSFGALEGPEIVVETLAPWVANLHIKDFTICRATHNLGFVIEGRPAGQGRLDVPWLLGRLREAGRDVNAILEQWTPPEPDVAATIAKEEDWARQSIAYLRTLIPE